MKRTGLTRRKRFAHCMNAVALSLLMLLATAAGVMAEEEDARRILKSMSDYMTEQTALAFQFDATLEVVTTDEQKLALASSGTLNLSRPDKIRVTRTGGFTDIELSFDGKTLTLLGKNLNVYTS